MFYQEKKTIISVLAGVLFLIAYCIYTFTRVRLGMVAPNDLKFWAITILIFIGIGIAGMIIIQVVFHILLSITIAVKKQARNEKCDDKEIERTIELEMVEDEMDKLIELKSMRIGFIIAVVGFVSALLSLVFNSSAAVMLNIIFISFCIGTIAEGATGIYYYRKGIKNG
ncbi:MAG: hypothetical protein PHR39_07350 [Actinomycetota bacterium]|nr:hypothetical protein [Actinomycetota bacterium]